MNAQPKEVIPAPLFLNAGIEHMQNRAASYDQPQGERSMSATVIAFNAIAGHRLTEEQGWLFMALLKATRSQQGGFKADSYEDGAAYFALAGEAASHERADKLRASIGSAAGLLSGLRQTVAKVSAAAGRHIREAVTPGGSQP